MGSILEPLYATTAVVALCACAVGYAAIYSPPFNPGQARCDSPWSIYFVLVRSNPTAGHELTWEALQQMKSLCKQFGPNSIRHIRCGTDYFGTLKCVVAN